jgi:hypothetical protein
MTATTLKVIILGDFPRNSSWCIWAKKINGEWSPESPAVVAPFSSPETAFHMVGECWNINQFKDKYLANGQTLEQFGDDWLASLNAAETVDFKAFVQIRESCLKRK